MAGDSNVNDTEKMSVLTLSHFTIAESDPIEHRETVMQDVNIEDMMKVNHWF